MRGSAIVHTMGKVGSSAISDAIRRAGVSCADVHSLNPDYLMKAIKRCVGAGKLPPPHLCEAVLCRSARRDWSLRITLVREPVERNLSAFFQNRDFFGIESNRDAEEVLRRFIDTYHHQVPLAWFDREFGETLGVDIYDRPFEHKQKYAYYEDINTLIFRTDCPDETKGAVLSSHLGTEVVVSRENVGANKHYASVYRRARQSAFFPREFLDKMYGSKYARHFWTGDELREFTDLWSAPATTAAITQS